MGSASDVSIEVGLFDDSCRFDKAVLRILRFCRAMVDLHVTAKAIAKILWSAHSRSELFDCELQIQRDISTKPLQQPSRNDLPTPLVLSK